MQTFERSLVRQFSVQRISGSREERIIDTVAAEEPLEIRVCHWFKDSKITASLAVTMRTPADDRELAAGLLLAEGVIARREQITDLRNLGTEPSNEIMVELSPDVDFEGWRFQRNSFVNSSCGVCGKRTREAVLQQLESRVSSDSGFRVKASTIEKLPELLASRQEAFSQTGGLHAAALVTPEGEIQAVYEDIGRHNALDKLIGSCLLKGEIPLRNSFVFMSSRSSFELIQKTAAAGAPMIATVGSPSSLAIDTAQDLGITLIGFVRDHRFNVYAGEWRVELQ